MKTKPIKKPDTQLFVCGIGQINEGPLPEKSNRKNLRFVCISGNVVSRSDGDIHFISAYKVAKLHGLNPYGKNVILLDGMDEGSQGRLRELILSGWKRLRPVYSGKYINYGEYND